MRVGSGKGNALLGVELALNEFILTDNRVINVSKPELVKTLLKLLVKVQAVLLVSGCSYTAI